MIHQTPGFPITADDILTSPVIAAAYLALVAMHRSLYWRTGEDLKLNTGAFIAGLEQAAATQAEVAANPPRRSSPPHWRTCMPTPLTP